MEETLAFPKMAEIDLLNNLEKISSFTPNMILKVLSLHSKKLDLSKFKINNI